MLGFLSSAHALVSSHTQGFVHLFSRCLLRAALSQARHWALDRQWCTTHIQTFLEWGSHSKGEINGKLKLDIWATPTLWKLPWRNAGLCAHVIERLHLFEGIRGQAKAKFYYKSCQSKKSQPGKHYEPGRSR